MAKHNVSPLTPPPISDERFSRNGMVPNVAQMTRLAEGFNFIVSRQKKLILMRSRQFSTADASGGIARYIWPSAFCTGENSTSITVMVGQAFMDGATGGTASINVYGLASGSLVVSKTLYFHGLAGTSNVFPDDLHHSSPTITGLTANTEYTIDILEAVGARIMYATIFEATALSADDTVTGVCDPGEFTAEAPIYDSQILDLVSAANSQWRHNAAHLLTWSPDIVNSTAAGDDCPTITSTTYVNIVDGSATVTSATPGVNMWTQYHNTRNRTTVPVRIAVRSAGGGAGTIVRLTDGTNNLDCACATGTTEVNGWFAATGTMPAQAGTKWDIHAKDPTAAGIKIEGVSVWEYET